jgi:NAD(P)-dependent dehydrogenase (short-subunit alcohol dehydrogenase family)
MWERATVLITGATSGLGTGVAAALAAAGHRIIVHGRDPDRVARTVATLGPDAEPAVADLASLAETAALAERIAGSHDRLDVLINNAAVGFGPPGEARALSRDGHELRMAVNYLAPVVLTRALLPLLRASAPSRVVNVGSLGQVPFAPEDFEFESGYNGIAAYRRSKLAFSAFTFDLADELRGSGVTVNCLHPASMMPTAMVLESRMPPMSTIAEGVAATVRLATDPALVTTTGEFYDGTSPSRSRPEAYDPGFRRRLRRITDELTAPALAGRTGTD